MSPATPDDVIDLTLRLVAAPSPNPPGDERAVTGVLLDYLGGTSGIEVLVAGPRPERPSVIAAAGRGSRALILAGHLDTHPVVGEWRHSAWGERVGARLYGRGTTDIKGGVAAMAVAFRLVVEQGLPPDAHLVLLANADEETGGSEGVAAVVDHPELPFAPVVVAEPSGVFLPWESLYLSARGTTRFAIRAAGTRTHSSLAGREGVESAVEALERAIRALREELSVLQAGPRDHRAAGRLTVVRIAGGEGYGVVPSDAEAEIEVRVPPGVGQHAIEEEVRRIAAAAGVDVRFADGGLRWMAPSEVDVGHPLARAAAAAWCDVLGTPPEIGCFPGGTDSRLFEASGRPALGGLGPGALVRAHQPDEYVEVDELMTAVAIYRALIGRYFDVEET